MSQRTVWMAGLAVAGGAAVLTAHGVFEVTAAARVPRGVAWLYPLITDGLAFVAYASTTRLGGAARRYAWAIVITAAGLSGLAQAAYLASDAALDPSRALPVAAGLRFGVGAWPAIAAAIAAHLVYLLATARPAAATTETPVQEPGAHREPAAALDVTEGPGPAGLTTRPAPGPVDQPELEAEPEPEPAALEAAPAADRYDEAVSASLARRRAGEGGYGSTVLRTEFSLSADRARAAAKAAKDLHEHPVRAVSG